MKHLGTVITALQLIRLQIQEIPPEERAVPLEAPQRLQIAGRRDKGMIDVFLMVAIVRC